MDTWKGIGVKTSHGGVVGSPMICTKMDQNRPSLMLEIIGLSSCCALLSIIKPLKRNFWFVGTTIFPHFGPWLVVCPFNQFNLIIFVTQDKFENFCYAMLWGPFWFILVYFGPFWYTSWMTPPPLYDWFWLLSSFKCPFYPEKGHISDSGKFETLLHCHAILTIWIKFESFWSILVHLMGDPTTPSWLVPTSIPFLVSILSRNGSY